MHYSPWLDPTLSRRRYIWLCSTAALCLRLPCHNSERSQTARNFYEGRKGDRRLKWDESLALWPSFALSLLYSTLVRSHVVFISSFAFIRILFLESRPSRSTFNDLWSRTIIGIPKFERIEINCVSRATLPPESFPIKVHIITNNNYFT